MSYLTQNKIAGNAAMQARVAQCVAGEVDNDAGIDPDTWALQQRRFWAAAPGWDAAWESSLASHSDNDQYDPGRDAGVVTDGQILSEVQGLLPTA